MKNSSARSRELTQKRLRARYLIVVKGYNQKEVAKIVDVSENTMCKWAKKYDWKEVKDTAVQKKGGFSVIIDGFFEYVRSAAPDMLSPFKKLWDGYIKNTEKDIGES